MTRRGAFVAIVLGAAVLAAGAWTVQSWRQPVTTAGLPAADTVQSALRLGKPAIIEFGSSSCYSCREMQRLLAAFTLEYGDRVTVASVDVLANHLAPSGWKAMSAGSKPAGYVHPRSLALLAREGISAEGCHSKTWDNLAGRATAALTGCAGISS
jgi:thiol-disulfide isomerase/thioredoxin